MLIYLATDVLTMDKAPRGVQPSRAKRGSAARSAAGRAKRGIPPLAERSEAVAPEPREGRQGKLEATELEANKHGANRHLREAGKRALHVRDILFARARLQDSFKNVHLWCSDGPFGTNKNVPN